MKHKKKKKK